MRSGIYTAETEAEKQAVYRFRYEIYVEEMGRYAGVADHENRLFREAEDETARIFYAVEDGQVVATSRLSWGGDAPFSERLIEHYQLAPFLAELPADTMAVGERGMVVPRLRGSEIFRKLGQGSQEWISRNRIQLIFGACEPHLLSLYLGQGCRTFAKKNINSSDAGYLIPIVTVIEDVEYLRAIGSPSAETAVDHGADARIPACVEKLVDTSGVRSQRLTPSATYWREVQESVAELAETRVSALDGLTEEEAERALGKSNIIQCSAGDRVLKKGGVARNMFVVLEGTLEVRDRGELLRVLSPGDVFGEMAFLLERPRAADVYAATDGRILSLSEGTLRRTIERDSQTAARLLLNVSKMLCYRLLQNR